MRKQILMALVLSSGSIGLAVAAHITPAQKAEYATATKEAAGRYAEDKQLCAEESTSTTRMQCLRDARIDYRKALAAAKVKLREASSTKPATAIVCQDCGKVTDVKVVEKEGESTPLGLIAGGVAGAVLGHQVGQGRGKDLATIAGAAGGAYAGRKVEQNVRSIKSWAVTVHMDNGEDRNFSFDKDPGFAAGDLVKQAGESIVRR